MTEAEKEHEALALEAKARKELRKRLENPLKLIAVAAEKEVQKRQARVERARDFKTYEEAHEAYGWGYITEQEFQDIVDAMERGQEYVETARTPVELAADMLREFCGRIERETRDFEFMMLPVEEQARIEREAMERAEKRKRGKTI